MEQQSTTLISFGALPLVLLMGLYKLRKFIFEVFDQIECIKMVLNSETGIAKCRS